MRILHVIDTLDEGGTARQLRLLAPALSRNACTVEVCCLGSPGRHVDELRRAGIAVHVLHWTRWFDATAVLDLRRRLRARPDVIHAWRLPSLRAIALAAPDTLPRVILSSPLPRNGRFNWWDCRLLRRVRCVTVADEAERQPCLVAGLHDLPWQAMPPAASPAAAGASAAWQQRFPRRIVCADRLERGRGFREAIWATDILCQVDPGLHLLIAGTGPRHPDLQAMIDGLESRNAHLLADTVSSAETLAAADVCWVPSRLDRGRHAALQAMAAGRAVVASNVPCLRELIRDGETGYLVPPGDPVALARRTLTLFRDPALRERLGRAAQADVRERFGVDQVATRWQRLYNDFAA